MKQIRFILWALVGLAGIGLMVATLLQKQPDSALRTNTAVVTSSPSLIDHKGQPITQESFLGKAQLIFFGFTHCPDVCPTKLFEISELLRDIAPEKNIEAKFITVDPERDTQELLAKYLGSFDPRITGITGTRAEIDKLIRDFRIISRKIPLEKDDYTMDHTATIFLLNTKGEIVGTISAQEKPDDAVKKIKRLIES